MKVGDRFRFKMRPDNVRVNGSLVLHLAYLGTEHVIYTWFNPDRPSSSHGETQMTRREFDEKCEAASDRFEFGLRYRAADYSVDGTYECVFVDDVCAVLMSLTSGGRAFRYHQDLEDWEEVPASR